MPVDSPEPGTRPAGSSLADFVRHAEAVRGILRGSARHVARGSSETGNGDRGVLRNERPNDIYASPNKVYDALCVGRPLIINQEARPSRWVTEQGVGLACRYGDVAALAVLVASLGARRRTLAVFAQHARCTLLAGGFTWERMVEELRDLYERLGPPDLRPRGATKPGSALLPARPRFKCHGPRDAGHILCEEGTPQRNAQLSAEPASVPAGRAARDRRWPTGCR